MSNAEKLKHLKELFDAGVISEEEFNSQKTELLFPAESTAPSQKPKKKLNLKVIKGIVFSLIGVFIILASISGIKTAHNTAQTNKRNEAVIAHIKPIMTKYGITDYTVNDMNEGYNFFSVYAEGFEQLAKKDAMSLLIELDRISDLDDPCGGEKMSFSSVNIYPGKDVDYYYYRITTAWVEYGLMTGINNYKKPGIYSSYGGKCVYECDN